MDNVEKLIAMRLWDAERLVTPVDPFSDKIGTDGILAAYRIQNLNVARGIKAGRRALGRKIGLTSHSVQMQLGVDEPDYGTLFADMQIKSGGTLKLSELIAPKIEAEIGLVLGYDITKAGLSQDDLETHITLAVSSLEIVDSRLKDWRIGILDTIADNGASARFVLGDRYVPLANIDLGTCQMELRRNGTVVSVGTGSATLGHPLKALAWLADTLIEHGRPLRAGDLVLTGALGPVTPIVSGDQFRATFEGLSPVEVIAE